MPVADLALLESAPSAGPRPNRSDDVVRHPRRGLVTSLGWLALVAALTAQAVVVLVASSLDPGWRGGLLLVCTLAQLPVLAVVFAACCCRTKRLPTPLGTVVELGSRVERAEAALRREQDRLHELRATLAAVSTAYQLLRDPRRRIPPDRRARLLRLQDSEMARVERLLADSLEPAGEVDLDAVIDPLVESVRVRGHQVSWSRADCRVRGRRDDITEAVHVLLENAALHAAGQGVEVAVVPHGHEVDVRVTDHGPGVASEILPRLFGRGARGPGSPGRGLGLNIARRRAREMGGRLELEPGRPGETGAVFVLTLPAASEVAACLAVSR